MASGTELRQRQSAQTDAVRWRAVLARRADVEHPFVYAVTSTGIYCRPSCPSKRPRRDRVVFFDSSADAERARYRACKRCHPQRGAIANPWIGRIRRACVYLATVDGHPSLAALARHVGGSPGYVQRNFKRLVGVTPREYAEACRLQRVKRGLRAGASVTSAMFEAGYGSSGRFYERAVPKLAMSPAAYRRGGAGMSIHYAIVDSPLGRLLVAATARGVCAVAMGESDRDLDRDLRREYPAATIAVDGTGLGRWTRSILAHLDGRSTGLDLPLDVRSTAFQWQVWQALTAIPYGETRTYGQIASAIGRPRAVRAVARACATNRVALAIPCHRVVAASGEVSGYRWGVERKKALLAAERKSPRPASSDVPDLE